MKRSLASTVLCLCLCCFTEAQGSYQYKSFVNPGATVTRVFGMNDHGEIVGTLDTFPSGLNARGDIVGNWDTDQSTVGHEFWISHGQIVSIDAPDAIPDGTAANGINARGQIVGSYIGQDGVTHGFLAEGATFTTLDCPGSEIQPPGSSMLPVRSQEPAT